MVEREEWRGMPALTVYSISLWLEPVAHAQRGQQLFPVFSSPSPINVSSVVLWAAL